MTVPINRIATHPGAFLLEQIEEMGLTVNGLARDIDPGLQRLAANSNKNTEKKPENCGTYPV